MTAVAESLQTLESRAWKKSQSNSGVHDSVADVVDSLSALRGMSKGLAMLRGEPCAYSRPASPSIARDREDAEFVPIRPPVVVSGEEHALTTFSALELQLLEDFKADHPSDPYFEAMIADDEWSPSWVAFAQHHGVHTRLLDVSHDPLVACWFATSGEHSECDGWIFAHDQPHRPLATDYRRMFDYGLDQTLIEMVDRELPLDGRKPQARGPGVGELPAAFFSPEANRRIAAQRGAFLMHENPMAAHGNSIVIRIAAAAKPAIQRELASFGVTQSSLFPE